MNSIDETIHDLKAIGQYFLEETDGCIPACIPACIPDSITYLEELKNRRSKDDKN